MRWMIVTDYLRRVCRASEGEAEHSRCDCPAERKVARTLSYSYTAAGLPRYVSRLVPGVGNKAERGDVALKIINCGTGIHAREITGVSLLANLPAHWLDRKRVVEGKGVPLRVDLGGRRIIKKKK